MEKAINKIEDIRKQYDCTGELIFRTALLEIISNGQQSYDEESVQETIEECYVEEKKIKERGGHPFMTAEFKIDILKCAQALSQIEPIDLLRYVYLRKIFIGGR